MVNKDSTMGIAVPVLRLFFSAIFLLLVAVTLYPTYGVLLGRFRYDEIFFIQNGWSAYNKYIFLSYFQPILSLIMKQYWEIVNGNVFDIWLLRFYLLFFVAAQWCLVAKLADFIAIKNRLAKSIFNFSAATIFVTIIAAFRGYEVRPEVFPNTALLLAALIIFKIESGRPITLLMTIGVVATSVALAVGVAISLRHAFLNATFFFLLMICYCRLTDFYKLIYSRQAIFLCLFAIIIIIAIVTTLPLAEIRSQFEQIAQFQSVREGRPWIEKLTIGGSDSQIYIKGLIAISCIILVTTNALIRKSSYFSIINNSTIWFLFSIFLYYVFLFKFDVRPFEYIRSIEWTLIAVTCLSAIKNTPPSSSDFHVDLRSKSKITTLGLLALLEVILYYSIAAGISLNSSSPNNSFYTKSTLICSQIAVLIIFALINELNQIKIANQSFSRLKWYLLLAIAILGLTYNFRDTEHVLWVLILLLTFLITVSLPSNVNLHPVIVAAITAFGFGFLWIYIESVQYLFAKENPTSALESIYRSKSIDELKSMTDAEIVKPMLSSLSIFDQINSRAVFCDRHPTGIAITYMWSDHPICLKDGGSFDLSLIPYTGQLDIPTVDISNFQFISLPQSAIAWSKDLGDNHIKIKNYLWIKKH